jgi:hypothetical protein
MNENLDKANDMVEAMISNALDALEPKASAKTTMQSSDEAILVKLLIAFLDFWLCGFVIAACCVSFAKRLLYTSIHQYKKFTR